MSEPLAILAAIEAALAGETRLPLPAAQSGLLAGRRVIVTSGPTYEPIDPVRFIGNRSSGKQGHAIARAAAAAGADVVLISGPVALADPAGVETRHVETADAMLGAVEAALPADVFIGAAAVADWRAVEAASAKLKKNGAGPPILTLTENPDILARVARRNQDRPALVVGFAAETHDLVANARQKLERKGCDLIVMNDVGPASGVFGGDENEVTIVDADGTSAWPKLGKAEIAARLVALVAERLAARPA